MKMKFSQPNPMNPKTQSETAKTYHSERVKRVAYAWADPLERPAGRVFSKEGLLLAALSELERELTALPGDAKERIQAIAKARAPKSFGCFMPSIIESSITDALTELHAQHQRETEEKCKYYHDNLEQYRQREIGFVHTVEKQKREIAALREENERLKLEKSRTSTHAHKGCDPTCQECT
jgi:hypothetical protein